MKILIPIKASEELPPETIGGLSDYVWTDKGAMTYDYEFKTWSKPPSASGAMADDFITPDIWYKEVELSEILKGEIIKFLEWYEYPDYENKINEWVGHIEKYLKTKK